MTRITFQWNYPKHVPPAVDKALGSFSAPFRSILYHRGCISEEDSISLLLPPKPKYPDDLMLSHVLTAAGIIKDAVNHNHPIAVYGDYDTDGITATALLTLSLQKISSHVIPFIPHRLRDGYGLNIESIHALYESGAKLLITVDNGIRSEDEIKYAKSLGLQVIITDHHTPSETLPDADAIVNPKIPGDPYPNKNLAGVGVAYKLVCELAEEFPEIVAHEYLDLVALGTIADIVPLTGENRYLVKQGLSILNLHPRQSLFSLINTAGLANKQISASDISFQLSPRINSSGRLSGSGADHLAPLKLLLSENHEACGNLSQILEIHNDRRKMIGRNMRERIVKGISSFASLPRILISLDKENDQGVAGIAAGYLTNQYYLPAVVGQVGNEFTTASCRSVPEFDMISSLETLCDLFTRFGGHKLAAGFTLPNQNIPEFHQRITSLAEKELGQLDLRPSIDIDAVVGLSDLSYTLYREVQKLEPTGEGNPKPIFLTENIMIEEWRKVGQDGSHLKFVASDGTTSIPAIAFNLADSADILSQNVNIAYHLSENEFRGKKELQIQVIDIQPAF